MNKLSVGLLTTFVVVLLVSGAIAYVFSDPAGAGPNGVPAPPAGAVASEGQVAPAAEGDAFFTRLFGPGDAPADRRGYARLEAAAARIALRFALAAFLAALLAFRMRRGMSVAQRNPYVAQTQILIAVVAAAMMMVVGDSAARAFGIFAAASLVRFRTNIRDPKEITVLLVCLGVGLAAGVGRWDMAIVLTLFVLLTLGILEFFEQSQVFRSMEVCVATRNVDQTNDSLKLVFGRHKFVSELRELNRQDEAEPLGKIVYLVNINTSISTDELSAEILSRDPDNIDSVEWDQKKSNTYIYR
jgi:hypothetical protein